MAALASDWLRRFRRLLFNCWKEINKTWQEARSQRLKPHGGGGRSEKQDDRPGTWLSETILNLSLQPHNGIQWRLNWIKIHTTSTKFLFFGPIGILRRPIKPERKQLCNHWKYFNKTWHESRSQCPLTSLCFWTGRKTKMAALASG